MRIKITDDLDLKKIAESGQCFRWESVSDNRYRIVHRDHMVEIEERLDREFYFSCDEEEFEKVWREYLDLDENYASIRNRIKKSEDPFLYEACEYGRGIRILRQDPWETLISFIISQNRNIPAIKKSIRILCGQTGSSYSFPTPEQILSMSDEALSECRLGYRDQYILAAARAVLNGDIVPDDLIDADEETTMRELTSIHGVGKKVASCMSLFGLHHIDAFPIDVWIRRVLESKYPDGYPMESYRPYNGIYQQYMFYYAQSGAAEL
ncbi:MAG: DNA-3-methyladenine glycosylase 2 family protein [Eubacterium sp.]|nr:DNA-3-methyladenine glycosylase 2 family protein [Eubacterium sp.]